MAQGAERLQEKILEDARLQAAKNIEDAKKQADEIIKRARDEAAKKRDEIYSTAQREADERKNRLIFAASLDARKKRLEAKQQMIEAAFDRALEKINTLPYDQYMNIILNMIVSSIRTGEEEIILSESDKMRMKDKLADEVNKRLSAKGMKAAVTVAEETREINGGFILRTGDVEVNNSFETLIKMKRDELEPEVVKALFGR